MKPPSIPNGFDCQLGRSIPSWNAEDQPGRHRYRCLDPLCQAPLTTHNRDGSKYFKHFPNTQSRSCRFFSRDPSTIHALAVELLYQEFRASIDSSSSSIPLLQFSHDLGGSLIALPYFQIDEVRGDRKWTCPRTGRQPDLTLLLDGQPVLLVEVWHKHKVDRRKIGDLFPYRWIEVFAADALLDSRRLKVLSHGGFPDDLEPHTAQGRLFRRSELDACGAVARGGSAING